MPLDSQQKIMEWLWGVEETRQVMGILKGRKKKKKKNMKKAFVLGNGPDRPTSKKWLDELEGVTYGCNAMYRDWSPDFLVANDWAIMVEIINSDYKGKCVFTDYEELPIEALEGIRYLPQYETAVHIGKPQDSSSFVFMGHKTYNQSNSQYHLIWLDESLRHIRWNLKPQFESMSTGLCALQLALETGYETINVIGFNGLVDSNYRNIYDGTDNYKFDPAVEDKVRVPETYVPLDAGNWESVYQKLVSKYPKTKVNLLHGNIKNFIL